MEKASLNLDGLNLKVENAFNNGIICTKYRDYLGSMIKNFLKILEKCSKNDKENYKIFISNLVQDIMKIDINIKDKSNLIEIILNKNKNLSQDEVLHKFLDKCYYSSKKLEDKKPEIKMNNRGRRKKLNKEENKDNCDDNFKSTTFAEKPDSNNNNSYNDSNFVNSVDIVNNGVNSVNNVNNEIKNNVDDINEVKDAIEVNLKIDKENCSNSIQKESEIELKVDRLIVENISEEKISFLKNILKIKFAEEEVYEYTQLKNSLEASNYADIESSALSYLKCCLSNLDNLSFGNIEYSYKVLLDLISKNSDDFVSGNLLISNISKYEENRLKFDKKIDTEYSKGEYDEFIYTSKFTEFVSLIVESYKLSHLIVNKQVILENPIISTIFSKEKILKSDRNVFQSMMHSILEDIIILSKEIVDKSLMNKIEAISFSLKMTDYDFFLSIEDATLIKFTQILKALHDNLVNLNNYNFPEELEKDMLVNSIKMMGESINRPKVKSTTVGNTIEESISYCSNNKFNKLMDRLDVIEKDNEIIKKDNEILNKANEKLNKRIDTLELTLKNRDEHIDNLTAQVQELQIWKNLCNGREIVNGIINRVKLYDDKYILFFYFLTRLKKNLSNKIHSLKDFIKDSVKIIMDYAISLLKDNTEFGDSNTNLKNLKYELQISEELSSKK